MSTAAPPAPPADPPDRRPPPNPDDDDGPRRGRPTKLTPEIFTKAVEMLSRGHYRYVVARALGVHRTTFKRWLDLGAKYSTGLYADLLEAVEKAEAGAHTRIIDKILAAGEEDPKWLAWWAERRYPLQWGIQRVNLADANLRLRETEKILQELRKLDAKAAAVINGIKDGTYEFEEDQP